MRAACRLPAVCLQAVCRLSAGCLHADCRPSAGCLQAACALPCTLTAGLMAACRPPAGCLPTPLPVPFGFRPAHKRGSIYRGRSCLPSVWVGTAVSVPKSAPCAYKDNVRVQTSSWRLPIFSISILICVARPRACRADVWFLQTLFRTCSEVSECVGRLQNLSELVQNLSQNSLMKTNIDATVASGGKHTKALLE